MPGPVQAGGEAVCCYCDVESGILEWTRDGRLAHKSCLIRAQRRALADKHRLDEGIPGSVKDKRKTTITTGGGNYA